MKIVGVSPRRGRRTLVIASAFGLAVERRGAAARRGPEPKVGFVRRTWRVGLIAGPSGSGKTTLLRSAVRRARAMGWVIVDVKPRAISAPSVVESVPGSLAAAAAALSRAGLADAALLVRPPGELSEGERHRLALARAMARAERAVRRGGQAMVVADEWCGALDRATARAVCAASARWARATPGVRLLVASGHDDVAGWLRADLSARAGEGGGWAIGCASTSENGRTTGRSARGITRGATRRRRSGSSGR